MDYDLVVEKLRGKIETLQQENIQLRDIVALLSNENYTLKCDWVLMTAETEEEQIQQEKILDLTRRFEQMKEELAFIQGSNTYKIWMKYRKIPAPVRRALRGIFAPVKMIYRGIKRVFR